MTTVPPFVYDLTYGTPDADTAAALAAASVLVGRRAELDLDRVAGALGRDVAERLAVSWGDCRRFWRRAEIDQQLPGAAVTISRPIVAAVQQTGRVKQDLTVELAALETHPSTANLLGALLDTEPVAGDTIEAAGDGAWTQTIEVPSAGWGPALGGMPFAGEVSRTVTLLARHAKWRDCRRRRLAAVSVTVTEVWPDLAT